MQCRKAKAGIIQPPVGEAGRQHSRQTPAVCKTQWEFVRRYHLPRGHLQPLSGLLEYLLIVEELTPILYWTASFAPPAQVQIVTVKIYFKAIYNFDFCCKTRTNSQGITYNLSLIHI